MKYYPPRYLFRRYELLRGLRPGQRFLEIGPGNLYLTVELLSEFEYGTLIEFNPKIRNFYDELPQYWRDRLELIIGDYLADDVNGRFDCVVACEVLEHVEEEEQFLVKSYELLEPGGQLILSVPAHMRYWSVHDESVGHLRRYERCELEALIRSTGYCNIRIISYGYPFTSFFRWLRIGHTRLFGRKKKDWDKKKQTQESGLSGMDSGISSYLGLLVNPTTFYPFCKLASLFNNHDMSNGFIVIAEK